MKSRQFKQIVKELSQNDNKIHVGIEETIQIRQFEPKKYTASVWLNSIPTIEELNRLYAILRASISKQKKIDGIGKD
jgi:hypothetical protein